MMNLELIDIFLLDEVGLVNVQQGEDFADEVRLEVSVALAPSAALNLKIRSWCGTIGQAVNIDGERCLFVTDVHALAFFGNGYNPLWLKVLPIKTFAVVGWSRVASATELDGRLMLHALGLFHERECVVGLGASIAIVAVVFAEPDAALVFVFPQKVGVVLST
jgi:hypothetical protein